MKQKTAVVAAMPGARERTAVAVRAGRLRNSRREWRRSESIFNLVTGMIVGWRLEVLNRIGVVCKGDPKIEIGNWKRESRRGERVDIGRSGAAPVHGMGWKNNT